MNKSKSKCPQCKGSGKVMSEDKTTTEQCSKCQGDGIVNGKQAVLARLNVLRAERSLEAVTGEDRTREQLEDMIHALENPAGDIRPEKVEEPTSALLGRLNAVLAKQGKPTLKAWKASRASLVDRLAKAEDDRSHVVTKQCRPASADGTETKAPRKQGKVAKKISAHLAKEEKELDDIGGTPAQIAEARRVNAQTGFTVANLLRFILAHKTFVFSPHINKLDKAAFTEWAAEQGMTGKKEKKARVKGERKPREPKADCLSPSDLAELLGKDARSVRVILRKKEKDVPAAWKVEGQRWGFKPSHKDDIVKFLKGEK